MKTNIKLQHHILTIGILLFAGTFFSGCDLEEVPYDFYSTDTYFESTDKLDMAVLGVYDVFSNQRTYGQYWMVYDTDTDISHISGAGTPGGHAARDIGHYYNLEPNNDWLLNTWTLYYRGIDRANLILEHEADVPTTDEADAHRKKQLIAETKCLRAMAYFDLVILFGDVPLKLTYSRSQDNFALERTDKEIVYDAIIQDFKEAAAELDWHDAGTYVGRLSKGAAYGLLARAYLFRGGYSLRQDGTMQRPNNYLDYYNKVVEYTDIIINSNKHDLNSSYERVFRNMCEGILEPKENMYEVSFFNLVGDEEHSSMMGTYNGPLVNEKSSYGRANSFIKTHGFFYDTYESADLRKDVAVAQFQITATNTEQLYNLKNSYSWAPGKWRRNWQTMPVKNANNTDVNYLLLRYADILLMRAEVENEIHNGASAKALECVNQVKRRAFGYDPQTSNPGIDYTNASFTGHDDFFTFIKAERARELCFEGLRRFDLIRWNALEKAIKDTQAQFEGYYNTYRLVAGDYYTTGKHELYPIPILEISQTRGALTQNPGYSK
jgi:hypothetical protein